MSPHKQIIAHSSPNIKTARITIPSLQAQSPTLRFRFDDHRMVYIIRHRLIHSLRIHHHTIQPRVYISAHYSTIRTVCIYHLSAMEQRITYPCRIIRHETPEHSHRCRDKHRIYLDNRLYLRLYTNFCWRLLMRTEPSRHTSNYQQYN